MTTPSAVTSNALAPELSRIITSYKNGLSNCFLMTGNITDYPAPGSLTRWHRYLYNFGVSAKFEIVGVFSPASGWTLVHGEEKFRELIAPADDGAAADPLAKLFGNDDETAEPQTPPLPTETVDALKAMNLAAAETRCLFVLTPGHVIAPKASAGMMQFDDRSAGVLLSEAAMSEAIVQTGSMFILLAEGTEELNDAVVRLWEQIEIAIPALENRVEFVRQYLAAFVDDDGKPLFSPKITAEQFGFATAGLNYSQIEKIILRGYGESGDLSFDYVQDAKTAIIRAEYGDVAEIIAPVSTFDDIGGLDHLKAFFQREIVGAIRDGDYWSVPMGVLMTGAPGTGKTIMAEALAGEVGSVVFKLNLGGQIASKWQGEGERNLRRFLKLVETLGGIVFIDEIDQDLRRGEGSGSGGSQQENRIFKMLMEFMSDTKHRGHIVFLAATNRPDLIDAALMRAGRFDVSVLFTVPSADERKDLFRVLSRKYGFNCPKNIPAEAINLTDGWTGAEMEPLIQKARRLNEREGVAAGQALILAAKKVIPTTKDKELMTRLGIEAINDLDLVPPGYEDMYWATRKAK